MQHISCFLSASILDYPTGKAGLKKVICCQHWRNKAGIVKIVGNQSTNQWAQKKPIRIVEKY